MPLREDRLERLCRCGSAAEAMRLADIRYTAPGDGAATGLPENSVDVHYSINVLEHVPASEIRRILREAMRVMRPGGVLLHQVAPSDHFSHTDKSILAINCLKFSQSQWWMLAGNRCMYQNRMRLTDYLDLFREAGFVIEETTTSIEDRSLAALQNGFAVHPDFASHSPEVLATVQIIVKARKPR